ncbi:MotA/TolQ/ExbB proton channel family protein [Alienimonas sp. DA493]|uniref:MotA/TolQ/ExbB proton channel family protein n=1 Tax=Alienimonas sp. DA493 TaxID=3373605 RepID=UPI0037548FC2
MPRHLPRTCVAAVALLFTPVAFGQEAEAPPEAAGGPELRELLEAGGVVGLLIVALSVAMVALIVQQMLAVRRGRLLPRGLAGEAHGLISRKRFKEAAEVAARRGGLLGRLVHAGAVEADRGYEAAEKAMEDAAAEEAARLTRRAEYLSVIATVAPMLGLLGTVWGMMLAFNEFSTKANPQVSELAPGIFKALVTTLLGLGVAVPAVASFALLRNRIDELVAEAAGAAEHIFSELRRSAPASKPAPTRSRGASASPTPPQQAPAGPVAPLGRRGAGL